MSARKNSIGTGSGKALKAENKAPIRKQPAVFPLGMRFGYAKDMCIIDFLDQQNNSGEGYCFYSIAVTKTHALEMINNLTRFVESQSE